MCSKPLYKLIKTKNTTLEITMQVIHSQCVGLVSGSSPEDVADWVHKVEATNWLGYLPTKGPRAFTLLCRHHSDISLLTNERRETRDIDHNIVSDTTWRMRIDPKRKVVEWVNTALPPELDHSDDDDEEDNVESSFAGARCTQQPTAVAPVDDADTKKVANIRPKVAATGPLPPEPYYMVLCSGSHNSHYSIVEYRWVS